MNKTIDYKLIMQNIKNKRTISKKFYTARLYQQVSYEIDVLNEYIQDEDCVLDVGSWDGRIGWTITDGLQIKPKELFLTDYTDESFKRIQLNLDEYPYDFCHIQKEDILSFSFPDQSFDVVVALGDVLDLMYHKNYGGNPNIQSSTNENLETAMHELYRVTKSGGYILLNRWGSKTIHTYDMDLIVVKEKPYEIRNSNELYKRIIVFRRK